MNIARVIAAAGALVWASGCSSASVDFETPSGAEPSLTVVLPGSEPVLDFGVAERGDTRRRELLLRNDGDADLHIDDVVLPDGGRFTWANEGAAAETLGPGEATILLLAYAPLADESFVGEILLVTNAGLHRLNVVGEGLAPALWMEFTDLELDFVSTGDVQLVDLELSNRGRVGAEVDLQLDLLSGSPAALELIVATVWVGPQDEAIVQLLWSPPLEGEAWARLRIIEASGDELSVGLHGVAAP